MAAMLITPLCSRASSTAWRNVTGAKLAAGAVASAATWAAAIEAVNRQAPSARMQPLRKTKLNWRCTGLRDIARRVPPAQAERLLLVQLIEGLPGAAEAGSKSQRGLVFGRGFRLVATLFVNLTQ